jgi:basic membrane protein A
VNLLVGYSNEYDDQNVCERVANQLIDAGARILFVAAGDCGLGAISAAGLRGVSVIAAGEDRSDLGPHVLASATKRFDRLTELSVTWYLEGRLPADTDLELGLIDDAVGLVGIRPDVPASVRSKVAVEAARLRAEEASGS